MSNEFFEVFDIGLCKLKNTLTGEKIGANYKIDKLTSAQNKFISYKIEIHHEEIILAGLCKNITDGFHPALMTCNQLLKEKDMVLLVIGNHKNYLKIKNEISKNPYLSSIYRPSDIIKEISEKDIEQHQK